MRSKLRCPGCGSVQYIHRPRSQLRKKGHVKHLWCVKCKKRTPHIEGAD